MIIVRDLLQQPPQNLAAYVQAECDRLGVSQRQLCDALGVGRRSMQRILEGAAQKVDALLLLKLAGFFGVSVDDLIWRVVMSDEASRQEVDAARRYGFIARNFDLRGLRKIGFIDTATDFAAVEERVKAFFGYDSVLDYEKELPGTAYSRPDRDASGAMRRFWMSAVHHQFKLIDNPNPFNRAALKQLVPEIRAYTMDVERGFTEYVRELYGVGATVIVESYVYKTAVYGGTLEVNEKPCVVLTNYGKRYDRLWRTLAHELCHVLSDLDAIRQQGYHVSGENTLFDHGREDRADTFAANLLLLPEKRAEIQPLIDVEYAVQQRARAWGVHPSIIYGLYLDADLKDAPAEVRNQAYARHRRDHLINSMPALRAFNNLTDPTWTKETLAQTAPLLKKALAA